MSSRFRAWDWQQMSSQLTSKSGVYCTSRRSSLTLGLLLQRPLFRVARLKFPRILRLLIIFQAPSRLRQKLYSDCWSQNVEIPLYQLLRVVLFLRRQLQSCSKLGVKGRQNGQILRHIEQKLTQTYFLGVTFRPDSQIAPGWFPRIILSFLNRVSWIIPFSLVQKANPYFMLSLQQPSYLEPLAQQKTPYPSLTPFTQCPSYLFLMYLPQPLDSSQMCIPHPSWQLFLHKPTYFYRMSVQFIVPLPYFLSFFHYPQKQLPEGQQYIFPKPSFKSFLKDPSKMLPLLKMIFPFPHFLPQIQSPSQVASQMVYLPKPCLNPSLTQPQQRLPSGHLQTPWPVIRLSVNYPQYYILFDQMNLPLPCNRPLQNQPQYLLPFLNVTFPGPFRHFPYIYESQDDTEICPYHFQYNILVSYIGSINLLYITSITILPLLIFYKFAFLQQFHLQQLIGYSNYTPFLTLIVSTQPLSYWLSNF